MAILRDHGFKLEITGCLVNLRSARNNRSLRKTLVTPGWIELYYLIKDGKWDIGLWNNLNQNERTWLADVNTKFGIDDKNVNRLHAQDAEPLVNRLHLLEGGLIAGNDNKELIEEIQAILEELLNRKIIHAYTVTAIKNGLKKIRESNHDQIKILRSGDWRSLEKNYRYS